MSHSPSSGEHLPVPAPQLPLQTKTGILSNPCIKTWHFRTAQVDLLSTKTPIAATEIPELARRQYEYPHVAMKSPVPPQSRGFGIHSILNPAPETLQKVTAGRGQAAARTIDQRPLAPCHISAGSRKRAEPASLTRSQQVPLAGQGLSNENTPALEASSIANRRNSTFPKTDWPPQPLTGPELRIFNAGPRIGEIRPHLTIKGNAPRPGFPSNELHPHQERPRLGSARHSAGVPWIASTRSAGPSPSHTSQSRTERPSAAFGRCTVPAAPKPRCGYRKHHPVSHSENYQTEQPPQHITLEANRGSSISPVELDLQQASKLADGKRKQADTSARFRARRRERVREASHLITTLQQEVRDLRNERDFYRNERNYIREFTSGQIRTPIPPRPRSPKSHLLKVTPAPASDAPERMEEERNPSDPAPAARRRRTNDHHPPFWQPYETAYAHNQRPPLLPPSQLQERPSYTRSQRGQPGYKHHMILSERVHLTGAEIIYD